MLDCFFCVLSSRSTAESGVWEEPALLPGLGMQDILWAMLARPASHQVLLDVCMQLVRGSPNVLCFGLLRSVLHVSCS